MFCLFLVFLTVPAHSAPFAAYVQRPWWEIVAPVSADRSDSAGAAAAAAGQKRKRAADSDDDDDDEDENESVAAHLRAVVGHSYSLLCAALFERRSKPVAAFFTAQWYASTVGALRLNALAVEHPSPLRDYAEVVDRRLRDLEAEAKAQAAANKASDSMSDEDEDEGEDGGAEDGDGQSDGDSSSSSDEDGDEEEEEDEENGDDDGGCERRRLRLAAAAAANSATDQRRAILLHLLPLLSRAMRVRLEDKIARKRSRTAARLAALAAEESGADADADAASGHQAAHARVRKVDRDSYPTQSYGWQLRYSRRHAQRLLFSTRLFPSMHASALYPTVAQANHCCAPNASVEHGQDAEARLHATRGRPCMQGGSGRGAWTCVRVPAWPARHSSACRFTVCSLCHCTVRHFRRRADLPVVHQRGAVENGTALRPARLRIRVPVRPLPDRGERPR